MAGVHSEQNLRGAQILWHIARIRYPSSAMWHSGRVIILR